MTLWHLKPVDADVLHKLSSSLSVSPRLARLLIKRGFSNEQDAHSFLFNGLSHLPNPFLLKGMEEAVGRILRAIDQKEKITIYGDYDVDGTCATSLLLLFFRDLG